MDHKSAITPGSLKQEQDLFAEALTRSPEERVSFLDGACHGDRELRNRLEVLLAANDQPELILKDITATADTSSQDETIGQALGRYKLLEQIGEGGHGVVYVAEQSEPVRRRVALKVIKLGMDTKQVVARFEAERQALAMMDHPNIAKVLDAGTTEQGRPYFVMELVRGIKITDYCDQEKMSTKDRLDLFIKVCHAVQHAHQKGIIHRDIKPSNILVTLHDGVPIPKVIDFGIAKATEGRLTEATVYTQLHQFIGTPAYMSPEQAEMSGLDIDTRSDIYSLGVLLYELLIGKTPFDGKELVSMGIDAMRKTIREQEPARPSTRFSTFLGEELTAMSQSRSTESPKLAHLLRGDLDWIVMKCLEKDRQRRYETSNGLALDLKRYQSNQPVLARPPSTTYRIQKSWRRNRVAITACMLIVTTIVIALVFSSRSFVLERRARIKSQDLYLVAEQNRTIAESNAHLARLNLYAADMNLAQVAIKANKIGRAARLIDRHVPAEGETDLRHWEWRYLWQQVQGNELFSLPAFDQDVFNIDHSPDGRYLAIALFDGRILIWDLHRNRKVKELKQASGDVAKCIYSPDGTTLIGFHRVEKEIPRWDARTLEEQSPLVVSDPIKSGHIRQMAFSPDNTYMAAYGIWRDSTTNSSKAMVIVWNGNTGDQLWTADVGPYSWHAGSVCFSADGKHLLIGDANSGLSRYKSLTGELEQKWPAHEGQSISALAVSPNGKILASGSAYSSGIIHLWDIDTGEALATLEGHEAWISWLEFSADGKTMASASADQTARIWDIENLTTQAIFKGHRDEIYTLSLDPKLPRLVTGSKDGVISVWNTQAEEREKQHLSREIAFERFYFSPNGKHLFIPDEMKNIVEHNPRTLEPGKVVPEFGKSSSLVFSPDSKLVFVAKPEPATDIYRLETMAFERTLEGVYPVQYIPDSNFLLTIRPQAREAVIWDVHDWKIIGTYTLPDSIRNNFFSIYNQLAAIEVEAGRVSILRVSLDHELIPLTEFKAHRRLLSGLAFSPNGEFLATTSMTGFGFLWNTDNWTQIMSLRGHSLGIHDVAFSPDSRRVLTTSSGQDAIILWDTTSHQEVMTISANGNLFHNVNLLAEGRTLVATTNTGGAVLYVWRAPTWDQITAEEAERNANE